MEDGMTPQLGGIRPLPSLANTLFVAFKNGVVDINSDSAISLF
jgi:hypothetical protein